MNTQDQDAELVGAYVLDALAPEEREAFAAHLETCSTCRAEVAELRGVVEVLPLACDLVEPSDAVHDRIVAAIAQEPADRGQLAPVPGGAPRRRGWNTARARASLLALAAAAVIAALGVWNVRLQQRVHDRDTAVATLQAKQTFDRTVASAIASGATVSAVRGTGAAPGASAAMVQPAHGGTAYLIVKGLPATPSTKVYQVWLLRGKTLRSAQVFHYSGTDPEIVHLPIATTSYPLTAVTLEPGPRGSRGPTTKPVLLGKLSV